MNHKLTDTHLHIFTPHQSSRFIYVNNLRSNMLFKREHVQTSFTVTPFTQDNIFCKMSNIFFFIFEQ